MGVPVINQVTLNRNSLRRSSKRLVYDKAGTLFTPSTTTCFSDSACSTPAVLDGPVGGVIDASGWIGLELVVNGNFSNGTTGWAATYQSSISNVNNTLVITATNTNPYAATTVNVSTANVYKVTFNLINKSATATAMVRIASSATIGAADLLSATLSTGSSTFYIKATTTVLYLQFLASCNVGDTMTFDDVSIKQVGIIATQTTSGYRPTLRKGVINRLMNSESPNLWTINGVTFADDTNDYPSITKSLRSKIVTEDTSTGQHRFHQGGLSTNTNKFKVYLKYVNHPLVQIYCGTTVNDYLNVNLQTAAVTANGTGVTDITISGLGNGWLEISATINPGSFFVGTILGATDAWGDKINVGHAGSVSRSFKFGGAFASESQGTYVVTTTAPASNGIGNYWLDFDGVSQFLQLSSVPFQVGDDNFVCASATNKGIATNKYVINPAGSGLADFKRLSAITFANPSWYSSWYDGVNIDSLAGTGTTTSVLSAVKRGSLVKQRINGSEINSKTITANFVATSGYIGCSSPTSGLWDGAIYAIVIAKATISDAEALLIEKYLAT